MKTVFILCKTNEVVAKLYTPLCSFINKLNADNYLLNLIIWELLLPLQFEAEVSKKLCGKLKKNSKIYLRFAFLNKLLMCFEEELLPWGSNAFDNLNIFQLHESVRLLSFSSSYIIGEKNTSGMSSSCDTRCVN